MTTCAASADATIAVSGAGLGMLISSQNAAQGVEIKSGGRPSESRTCFWGSRCSNQLQCLDGMSGIGGNTGHPASRPPQLA